MAAGAGLAVDGFAQAQPFGCGFLRQEAAQIEGMLAFQSFEGGAQGAPVAPLQGSTERGYGIGVAICAAQQKGERGQRTGKAGLQAFAVQGRFGTGRGAAHVPCHDRQFGGESPLMLVLGRRRGGTHRRGEAQQEETRQHVYCSLTFCSIEPPLSMVHSTIEPSYRRAFLLPISSLETNQPTDAQWPVLQKLIWSPLAGTLAIL